MIQGCLNTGADFNYTQVNNVWEIADGPAYNWCNTTAVVLAWAAGTPNPDAWKNPFGGSWRIQPEDYVATFFRDPQNYPMFQKIRELDLSVYPPEQVPQYHPAALKLCFGLESAFSFGISFEDIAREVCKGNPVILCLINPSHYILANQYDSDKKLVSFKDPLPVQWKQGTMDSNGNKWFGPDDMSNISPFSTVVYKK